MKILLVEDQAMYRGMVMDLCRSHFDAGSVEEATTGAAALARCGPMQPDVVLLDLDLPDADGLDLIARIAAAAPRARVIVLSSHTEEYVLHRCLHAGIAGFVDKNNEPPDAVLQAIEAVTSGRTYFTASIGRIKSLMREDPMAFNKMLTDREQEMLRLMGEGYSNDELASRLGLSRKTIDNHRRSIMAKLGIHTTPALMRYAIERGFTRLRAPAARS